MRGINRQVAKKRQGREDLRWAEELKSEPNEPRSAKLFLGALGGPW